jgi:starch synthase
VPLVGFIGRLDWQKGPDLIQDAVHNHRLLEQDIQMVMLGSGDPGMEDWMAWAVRRFLTALDSPRGGQTMHCSHL